ncbi:PEP-CTERM sorting domain-containing protein [Crocosphaera sp. UHCC 0190]|uniref:PEP-CTERM sorting domain-containing protein n=1 Tax=Crocosphaera sp. UHCC 0190 TaxID=3110246 RepID=UPI002B20AFE6|nr:PEP-CTERM sorting domain-containing protein [Crocosphaera sp. UHCC 0190]MEA5508516.1 PEP-CTERM sorting domain-containing protein [Crocosphaera sp. UHCC 0190]
MAEIQDPVGETNINITNTLYVLQNGVPTALTPNSNGGFICNTQGSGTPIMAINRSRDPNGLGVITQCQGDTVGLTNQGTTPFTTYLTAQIIPDYQQDPSQLPPFLPRQGFTVNPGENRGLLQASPAQTTPESSSILGLLVLGGLGASGVMKKQKKCDR